MKIRTLLTLVLLLVLTGLAEAQRGGRSDGSRRRPNDRGRERRGSDLGDLKFQQRLWYGVGGTLFFQGFNGESYAGVGLTPMVGYKITDWLSAGPRVGATATFIKSDFRTGVRQRVTLVDYSAGAFLRAKVLQFYAQTEFNSLSIENLEVNSFGETRKTRSPDTQLLVGIGYNPGGGGGSTDIGLFYNLFDDVQSTANPLIFRVMLTLGY